MSEKKYDVIIAGAGMAGLTAGGYLCRYGYNVLICEQADKPGGLVSSFEYKGFTLDAGIRAIENSGIVFPMLKQLDIQVDMAKSPVSIGIGNRLIRLENRESLTSMETLLSDLFPENKVDIKKITAEIRKVMNYMDVLYGIENPLFMDFNGDTKYLLTTLLPWFVRYQMKIGKIGKLNQPVASYLRHFTSNQALIDMIVQHFFKDTPTFFGLSYFGLYLDYNYPVGGTGVLPNKMCTKIKELGGELLTNTGIISVNSRNKTIQTSGGATYEYDKLIWAADQKTLYAIMEEDVQLDTSTGIPWETQKQKVSSHRGNDSVLTFYFGVDQSPQYYGDVCGPHMFFTPDLHGLSSLPMADWKQIATDESLTDDQRKVALQRWTNHYLDLTTFEISIPALRDASLAPEGQTGIITSTLFEYDLVKYLEQKGWYDSWKDGAKAHMIQLLTNGIFPEFAEKLLFGLTSSPLTIEHFSGNGDGAITGWAFSKDGNPAENRFKKIRRAVLTPLADIYQAGQWTFSPSGLPISILTGKVAADLVHKELKRKLKRKGPAPIEPDIITT